MKWLCSVYFFVMPSAHALFASYHAYQAYAQGNMQEATELFGACVAHDHHDWQSLYNLGTIALNQENYTEAVKHFDKVLELQPDHDSARERLMYARRREEERNAQQKHDQQQDASESQDNQSQQQTSDASPQSSSEQSRQQSQPAQENDASGERDDNNSQDNKALQNAENGQKNRSAEEHAQQSSNGSQQKKSDTAPAQQSPQDAAEGFRESSSVQHETTRDQIDALAQQLSKAEQHLLQAADEIDREAQKQLLYRVLTQDGKEDSAKVARHNW